MSRALEKLRDAVAAEQWTRASGWCDRLRQEGWTYERLAQEFGGVERWEEISQAMDEAESD